MKLDEIVISRAIIESYAEKLVKALDVDVAIVGAGPAGMVCGYYLAKAGKQVVLFERKLSVGGGMWGGGIMFNEIVVQEKAKRLLDEFDIKTKRYEKGFEEMERMAGLSCGAKRASPQLRAPSCATVRRNERLYASPSAATLGASAISSALAALSKRASGSTNAWR
jgi:thiamine thiazole synthase